MKSNKLLLSSLIILTILSMSLLASAEYFKDIVVTDGIWVDSRAYSTLSDALSTIGSSNRSLYIANDVNVTDDVSVSSNVDLHVLPSGLLTISSGKTLTINGPVNIGLYQAFSGDGNVSLSPNSSNFVYPEWWGVYRDGSGSDSSAVSKAIKALPSGGHIVLTPGDWYWSSVVPEINEELPSTLTISGYGAVIHLSSDAPTAFSLKSLSGNQSEYIQNITLEGFTVDANDTGAWDASGSSMLGSVVTSAYNPPDYSFPTDTSFKNITIRDILAKNLLETTYDTSVIGMIGISIGLQATTESTEIKDIYINNVEILGGRAGVVISRQGNNATNVNTWIDNILVNNVRHVISQEKSGYYPSSNIMIGGGGRCGDITISNCYGENSGDVGVEVDCAENSMIENVVMRNSKNAGFYISNYADPLHQDMQKILVDKCVVEYVDSSWSSRGPGYNFRHDTGVLPIRAAVVRDSKYVSNSRPSAISYGQYIQGDSGEHLSVKGFTIEDNCTFDGTYSTQASLVGFNLRSDENFISDVGANITFTNSSNTTMAFELFRETNVKDLVINGVDLSLVAGGTGSFSNAYLLRQGSIGVSTDVFGGGSMKNVSANVTGIDFYPLCTYVNDGNITAKFVVENCDFAEVDSFSGLVNIYTSMPNVDDYYSRIRFRQNTYPASMSNHESYSLTAGTTIVKNKNFRKGHFFPDSSIVTLVEESYDQGANYISADDVSKVTVTEGTWMRLTTNAPYDFDLYFEDD